MSTAIIHVILLIWTALAWTCGAFRICQRTFGRAEPLLVVATSFALGAGATAVLLTAAATLNILTSSVIYGIQIAWSLLALTGIRNLLLVFRHGGSTPVLPWTLRDAALVAILMVVALATLVTTLAPPTSLDATVYHLRIPREFLRVHRLAPLKDDVRMFQPLYVQMLFAAGIGLKSDVLAALIHWLFGIATVVAAGAWARKLAVRSALLTVSLFALTPLVIWESTSCFIDFGLTLFTTIGLLWATRPDLGTPALALASFFAGLAAGSKFTGCASAGLIGATAAAAVWPDRRAAIRRLFIVAIGALIVSSPWYIRNAILVGNPVYPLANPIFGGPPIPLSSWHYGFGRDLFHLLTSPIDLLLRGDEFDSGWAIGPAFLALVPVALTAKGRTKIRNGAAVLIGAYWLFWFYSSPQTRLLLPILPVAAALATVGLETLLVSGIWTRLVSHGLLIICFGAGLGTALIPARQSARAAAGIEDRSSFLRRMTWDYEAYEQTNRRLGPQARLAVFGVSNVYYLEPPTTVVAFDDASRLRREGYSHLLRIQNCDTDTLRSGETVIWHGKYWNPGSRFQGTYPDHQLCAQLVDLAS